MQSCPEAGNNGWQRVIAFLNDAKMAPVWLTLILGALGSVPLVFLTPPFQVPDEIQHYYRAYQLSEFHIHAEVQNGISGGTVPSSLTQLIDSFSYTSSFTVKDLPVEVSPAPLSDTFKRASIPLDGNRQHFVAYPGAAFYSPLPYLPQTVGILIGRLLGLGPLYLLYLGRLFNCLTALGLLALAAYWMPFAPELVLFFGLLPMALYQYASNSPDAVLIACAFVFTALCLASMESGKWKNWQLVAAVIAGAVFCSIKPTYVPLLAAGMIPGLFRKEKSAQVIRAHLLLIGGVIGLTLAWFIFARTSMTPLRGGGQPTIQLNLILHHPLLLVHVFGHTLGIAYLATLYVEAVGVFGWLSVMLTPNLAYILPFAGVVIVWRLGSRGKQHRSVASGLWHLTMTIAASFLVMLAMYLMSSHLGESEITRVQGRYFLPVLVLAGAAAIELIPRRTPLSDRHRNMIFLAVIILAQIVVMDATIIGAFQVL